MTDTTVDGYNLTQMTTDIAANKTAVEGFGFQTTALQTSIATLTSSVQDVQNKIAALPSGATFDPSEIHAELDALTAKLNTLAAFDPTTLQTQIDALKAAGPVTADAVVQAFVDGIAKGFTVNGVVVTGGTGTGTGTAGGGTTGGGTNIPPPGSDSGVGSSTDTNTYPLTLSEPDVNGTQTAGEGPNQIDLYIASNPGGGVAYENDVIIVINGKAIIAPVFHVSSLAGMTRAGSNHLVLKGPWGNNPKLQIKGVSPGGIGGFWFNGATLDYGTDLVANGPYDSRGGISVNSSQVFNSAGADMTITLPQAVVTTTDGAGSATLTQISGQTLDKLLGTLSPGGSLTLPEQTIVGTGVMLVKGTLAGAGIGKTVIDATGVAISYSKGAIVPAANGDVIQDVTIKNAYINASLGLNGAGVRNSDNTVGFTLKNVEITGCQNGVLTDAATEATITFDTCHFHGNGEVTQPGNTHEMYIGGTPAGVLNLIDSTFEGCRDGHEVKCRMGTVNSTNCTVITGGNGSGYDMPNGGNLNITGGTTSLGGSMADRFLLGHAMENRNNAATGHTVHVKDHVFGNASGQAAFIQTGDPEGILILENCTYTGSDISLVGWKTVTGALTKAS